MNNTKSTLKPSVIQMLSIGLDIGFDHIEQAYIQYMRHYDCFFLIEDYANQYNAFVTELADYGLITIDSEKRFELKDLTIKSAIELVNAKDSESHSETITGAL